MYLITSAIGSLVGLDLTYSFAISSRRARLYTRSSKESIFSSPIAEIIVFPVLSPHSWQTLYAVLPSSVRVGAFAGTSIQLCSSLGESSNPHTVQTCALEQVASGPALCPSALTTVCATRTSPQVSQWLPSVRPVSVQVGATASSTTSVCPSALTVSWATRTSPQTSQWLPSVRPVAVQVAATAASITSV